MNQDAVNDEKVKKKISDTYLLLLLSMLLSLYLLFHVVYIYLCLPPPPPPPPPLYLSLSIVLCNNYLTISLLYLTIALSTYCYMLCTSICTYLSVAVLVNRSIFLSSTYSGSQDCYDNLRGA